MERTLGIELRDASNKANGDDEYFDVTAEFNDGQYIVHQIMGEDGRLVSVESLSSADASKLHRTLSEAAATREF